MDWLRSVVDWLLIRCGLVEFGFGLVVDWLWSAVVWLRLVAFDCGLVGDWLRLVVDWLWIGCGLVGFGFRLVGFGCGLVVFGCGLVVDCLWIGFVWL